MKTNYKIIIACLVSVVIVVALSFSGKKENPVVLFEAPGTEFIHTIDWPPAISTAPGTFTCKTGGSEVLEGGIVEKRVINGHDYCVTTSSGAAAGSVYTDYIYTTPTGDGNTQKTLKFTLRFVQCGNYDEPKKSICEKEREAFDIGPTIHSMVYPKGK